MDTKREKKIRDGFGWKKLGLGTKMLFNSLKTDEELMLCALSCRAKEKETFALQAIQRIADMEALYRIATEAPSAAARTAAIDRFKDDRAMLLRVWRITWSQEKWLLDASRKRAAEHLAVLEQKQMKETGGDAKRLADLLCRGELIVCYTDALAMIRDGQQLLRVVLNASAGKYANDALNRLAELAQQDRNVDLCFASCRARRRFHCRKMPKTRLQRSVPGIGRSLFPTRSASSCSPITHASRISCL